MSNSSNRNQGLGPLYILIERHAAMPAIGLRSMNPGQRTLHVAMGALSILTMLKHFELA